MYRWTRHRVYDRSGRDKSGLAAISMWWVARAAAEETLQGSPNAPAWLKLFRTQLSDADSFWLRWKGDMAESGELRRAFSGLYGRFFARALLRNHLGLTRFIPLKRNGVRVHESVEVRRIASGDIPDWIAWDGRNAGFALAEAKGRLTGANLLSPGCPACISAGKNQFDRVAAFDGFGPIRPAEWVAATSWATDVRGGYPATVLWDPPTEHEPYDEEEAAHHRKAMTNAWLDSIAGGLGWRDSSELIASERARNALVVRAEPGEIPESEDWQSPKEDEPFRFVEVGEEASTLPAEIGSTQFRPSITDQIRLESSDNLSESEIYPDPSILRPREPMAAAHEKAYLSAAFTRSGVRPIRGAADYDQLLREQERARNLEEPAMLVGIPINFNSEAKNSRETWIDGAGLSSTGELAVFDLRRVDLRRLDEPIGR